MNLTGLFFKTSTNFHSADEFLLPNFRCQTRNHGSNFTFSPIQLDLTPSRTRNLRVLHGFSRGLWSGLSYSRKWCTGSLSKKC